MPLAVRHRADAPPALGPLPGLRVVRTDDTSLLAALQGRERAALDARRAAGHHACLAWLDDAPAAWGWVATRSADVGEVGATVRLPDGERYLWNFVTLARHRGRGVYPRLLDAIVRAESAEAAQCWIAHAPENHASAAGIRKAGFTTLAALSFDATGGAAVRELHPGGGAAASRLLGLPHVEGTLAPCWRCARARRDVPGRAMTCAAGACRCDYQQPSSGCAAPRDLAVSLGALAP